MGAAERERARVLSVSEAMQMVEDWRDGLGESARLDSPGDTLYDEVIALRAQIDDLQVTVEGLGDALAECQRNWDEHRCVGQSARDVPRPGHYPTPIVTS